MAKIPVKEYLDRLEIKNITSLDRFVDVLAADISMKKERKLMALMIKSYTGDYHKGWVSTDQILKATSMSAFNQAFQRWRKPGGIVIKNNLHRGKSYYKLFTHPADLDPENKTSSASQIGFEI